MIRKQEGAHLIKMNLKFVVILLVLISFLHGTKLFDDFAMLSCSHQRNITIVMHGITVQFVDVFFHNLKELVQNDACFKVNIHLPEGRVYR